MSCAEGTRAMIFSSQRTTKKVSSVKVNMFATREKEMGYSQLNWIQRLVSLDNPSPGFKHLIKFSREVCAKLPDSMLAITVHGARILRCRPTARMPEVC